MFSKANRDWCLFLTLRYVSMICFRVKFLINNIVFHGPVWMGSLDSFYQIKTQNLQHAPPGSANLAANPGLIPNWGNRRERTQLYIPFGMVDKISTWVNLVKVKCVSPDSSLVLFCGLAGSGVNETEMITGRVKPIVCLLLS